MYTVKSLKFLAEKHNTTFSIKQAILLPGAPKRATSVSPSWGLTIEAEVQTYENINM